jgi:toxin ParE1/3/4
MRIRLSQPARADVERILAVSAERWGSDGQRRYIDLLTTAMRKLIAEPQGPGTRDRSELLPGIRSFHIRHARTSDPRARVRHPVHILYYRIVEPNLIEVVRVLHDRMEPGRHMIVDPESEI